LIAASSLGIDVSGIIALASVLTLAISLSVQNALSNVIGGFTLLYTKPFKSGDYVEIASESGTVDEIGMSYTKLITPDNKVIYIPNSAVVAADIVNFTVSGTRRVDLTISASYDAPTDQVIAALYDAAKVPGVMTDPAPFAAVNKYGDSAIEYVLRVWTKTDDYWDVNFAINEKVRASFSQSNIEMTYPHLNVHIQK
jgi:small conductance mechanosensitive channel